MNEHVDFAPDECDLPPTAATEPAGLPSSLAGEQVQSTGCAKGFQLRFPVEDIAPQSFQGGMHICRSQELKPSVDPFWLLIQPGKQPPAPCRGFCPPKGHDKLAAGMCWPDIMRIQKGTGTSVLPNTTNLTNYGVNSKSISEGLS